ncbi:hypothetical protein [Streptomyces sp. NPDC002328]|uniref:hypothetical protein n=1 Tax=Streptomyces sp. NPDC002328 TaxID=3364642 RepID=UPI0036882073
MSDDPQHKHNEPSEHHPAETALEEVLREIEEAELRSEDTPEERGHRGEAAEAATPNTQAQENATGD